MNYKKIAIATTLGLGLVAPLATPFSEVGLVAKANNEEVTFYPMTEANFDLAKYTFIKDSDKFYYGHLPSIKEDETISSTYPKDYDAVYINSNSPILYIFATDKEITKDVAVANLDKATKVTGDFDNNGSVIPGTFRVEFPTLSKETSTVETAKEEGKSETTTPVETTVEEKTAVLTPEVKTETKEEKTTTPSVKEKAVVPTPEVKTETKEEKTTTSTVEKKVEKPAVKTLPETSANKNFGLYTIGALILVLVAGVVAKIKKAK